MDESLKEVLSKHCRVLVRYINPTDSLIAMLVEDRVLPAAMIDDVKKATCRKEKNEKLLKALRLRGNAAYRKFREAMMKCGHIFLADLLYEEDKTYASLVEESDFSSLPNAPVLNLSPDDIKRLASALDAKVKYRVLKTDWKQDSSKRLDALHNRSIEYKSLAALNSSSIVDSEVKQLQDEVKSKSSLLRAMSNEVSALQADIGAFLKRHKVAGSHVTTFVSHETMSGGGEDKGRFKNFESSLANVVQRLCGLLGEDATRYEEGCSLADADCKVKQIQELIRELEAKLDKVTRDRDEALELLSPGAKIKEVSTLQGVQRHINTEQIQRASLLKAVNSLSRKLRGMTQSMESSGLRALQQSAVTGQPDATMVDYRFLMSHLALVEADAEHIAKKLTWKDLEVKALRSEVTALRRRFMCRKESPEYQANEVVLGD